MKKDIGVLGKGKSDPYAIIKVGAQSFRTQTIDNTVDPKWDYWCEVNYYAHNCKFPVVMHVLMCHKIYNYKWQLSLYY